MNISRFIAATSREALRKVKERLGPDAVILSNRPVDGGVEIMALRAEDIPPAAESRTPEPAAAKPPPKPVGGDPLVQALVGEIQSLRGIVEEQLAGLTWGGMSDRDPSRCGVLRDMLAAGFSPSLAKQVIGKLPAGLDREQAQGWVRTVLARNLNALTDEAEVLDRGGVYALTGPTGVGKTTTTAKLAARFVVRHGAHNLGLVTTDGYRIGAHDQLGIYGKILGVAVYTARDADDLRRVLEQLRNKRLILIDTAGMGQRDRMVAEQAAMLQGCAADVKRLLLLNATCSGDTLEDVHLAYRAGGLAGCILTKLDEAVSPGTALDLAIRRRVRMFYVASGQRVPEDLHLPNVAILLKRAFRSAASDSPYAPGAGELAALMSAAGMRRMPAPEVCYG